MLFFKLKTERALGPDRTSLQNIECQVDYGALEKSKSIGDCYLIDGIGQIFQIGRIKGVRRGDVAYIREFKDLDSVEPYVLEEIDEVDRDLLFDW